MLTNRDWILQLFCAWVIWGTGFGQGIVNMPLAGFDDRQSCETDLKSRQAKANQAPNNKPPMIFRCLPDTIDPRQAKSK